MSKRGQRLLKVERCGQCRRRLRRTIQQNYQYRESGLDNVYLHGVAVFTCDCGEEVIEIPQMERLHNVIVYKLLLKPSLLRGDELCFLRKHLGLKQADFAGMLRVVPETFSRWETGALPIGEANERLCRFTVVLVMSEQTKKAAEQAHNEVSDMYLDFLNEIKEIRHKENSDARVNVSRDDLENAPPLIFRYGPVRSPSVEVQFS